VRYLQPMKRVRTVIRAIRRHPFASDAALALVLLALVASEILTSHDYLTGSEWVYAPVAFLMTVPLAWRRRAPLVVVALVMGAFAAQSVLLDPTPTPDIELIPALVAVYSVGLHAGRSASYVGGLLSLVAGLIWLGVDDFLLPTVMFGGAWFAGRLVQRRQLYAEVLEERTRVLEREQEANARIAAAEERFRLARELHDVVGHSVSVMVVQAGAERLALGDERPETRDAFLAIERTGREALAEMSRLLGLLRREDEGLTLAPQPSLADVESLVAAVRDAGVPVELRIEGARTALPAGLDVSAYRIVQEALTNVVKHAGDSPASVVIRYGTRALDIEVADEGNGASAVNGHGYGLAGMRERVALHGGTLEAGPRTDGGFLVKARLRVEAGMR
jgi:signal transduction histidine kinase